MKRCTLTAPDGVRRVAQLRDRGQGGEAVGGQVDLGHQLDAELGRASTQPAISAPRVAAAAGLGLVPSRGGTGAHGRATRRPR